MCVALSDKCHTHVFIHRGEKILLSGAVVYEESLNDDTVCLKYKVELFSFEYIWYYLFFLELKIHATI